MQLITLAYLFRVDSNLNIRKAKRLLQTVRHLKPRQFAYRLRYIAKARFGGHQMVYSKSTPIHFGCRPIKLKAPFISRKRFFADDLDHHIFTFLNKTVAFHNTCMWNSDDQSRLWRYNLHYFDYLFPEKPLRPETADHLISSWIEHNPPGTKDAWEPFPASLRIVNWIKFFLQDGNNVQLRPEWLQSLFKQTVWLEQNIEHHLLANHLFKNAKALVFAGMFFDTDDAKRWLSKGVGILRNELEEQILQDGGHFERSPMYHCMILEDCLDMYNITCRQNFPNAKDLCHELFPICRKMATFLAGLIHTDGTIALFNDAALNIEANPEDIFNYYETLMAEPAKVPEGTWWSFPETGYYVIAPQPGNRLLIDCGNVGPDYQPGHSHCDTLSFELSLNRMRVIVDSGCFQYEDGNIRQYNRGNTGHNTVTIGGENQSEVWGAHRCAKRAYPVYAKLHNKEDDGSIVFEGAHDGYKRLYGRPVHHRRIHWIDDEIRIEDRIEGSGLHAIESRLHIHPDIEIEPNENRIGLFADQNCFATITATQHSRIECIKGWYCPEFGLKLPCNVIRLNYTRQRLPFGCGWKIKIHKRMQLNSKTLLEADF